ncbi:GNAT family N-acetyltransferase [Cribrihabitans neustonicus]|uniref:GNAT family N-acetyltransferase n=1 Tax=Cribrihabitans neustonicus TaxID=1429085 RepID=UPI003B5CD11E
MQYLNSSTGREEDIIGLFTAAFTASEGAEEGALIGRLVRGFLSSTAPEDIHIFLAEDGTELIGSAIFTRLTFAEDSRTAFILSPMAVAPARQGTGVGQGLLRHALEALRGAGVEIAITYGDPAFYSKVGFKPMDPAEVPAPHPLSQPVGWIGQCLSGGAMPPLAGPCICVPALDDPALW